MPSSIGPETPPLDFERKLSSSIRRLRASSISHDPNPPTFRTPSYRYQQAYHDRSSQPNKGRSPLGLHRLKSVNRRSESHLATEEAVWFFALPDKVRRQYFTREEQILLRAACEIALANHPIYDSVFSERRPRTGTRSNSTNSYANSPINHVVESDQAYPLSEAVASSDEECVSRQVSFSSPCRRTHSMMSTGSLFPNGRSRMDSFVPNPINDAKLAPKKPKDIRSPPKYYLDPKVKAKIRKHLATSRGFDEVLQYGFPIDDESPDELTSPPAHQLEEDSCSFDQSSLSCSSAHSEEDEEISDVDEGPETPGSDGDLAVSEWDFRQSAFPFHHNHGPVRIPGREMTLRLTLTKPEVRSKEDVPSVCHDEEEKPTSSEVANALELEELTFSDDLTGKHGAFAVVDDNDKGLKKLWKKLQRNSSFPVM